MSIMQQYDNLRKNMIADDAKWADEFKFLESLIDTNAVIMCYPKGLFREGSQSVDIIMVSADKIVSAILGGEREIKVYNRDISKVGLYRKKTGDLELRIFLRNSDIIMMANADDTNEDWKEEFGEILLNMFKLLNK